MEARTIRSLCPWTTNKEVVRRDITMNQILLVYHLYKRDL